MGEDQNNDPAHGQLCHNVGIYYSVVFVEVEQDPEEVKMNSLK